MIKESTWLQGTSNCLYFKRANCQLYGIWQLFSLKFEKVRDNRPVWAVGDWKHVRDNRKFEIAEFEISELFLVTLYRGFAGDSKIVRDKREFEITEFEITGFYCISSLQGLPILGRSYLNEKYISIKCGSPDIKYTPAIQLSQVLSNFS